MLGVEVGLPGEHRDLLAAALADRAQRDQRAVRWGGAQLLGELADRGVRGILVRVVLALRDRPGALVLARPERATHVPEQQLRPVRAGPVQEQAGTGDHPTPGCRSTRRADRAGRHVDRPGRSSRGLCCGGDRGGEVPALPEVAAQLAQLVQLARRLHRLRGHRQAERVREPDQQHRDLDVDLVGCAGLAAAGHEPAGQLQRVHRQVTQVGQVRVAGAEVVDGDLHPHLGQLVQRVQGSPVVPIRSLSVSSSCSARAGHPVSARIAATSATMPGSRTWRAARLTLTSSSTPGTSAALGRLPAGLRQHPAAERHDQPGLLRQRDERGPGRAASVGQSPTDQRLDAHHRSSLSRTSGW